MQIALALGKMSLAEADLVRRTSAKYSGRSRLRTAAHQVLTKPPE